MPNERYAKVTRRQNGYRTNNGVTCTAQMLPLFRERLIAGGHDLEWHGGVLQPFQWRTALCAILRRRGPQ